MLGHHSEIPGQNPVMGTKNPVNYNKITNNTYFRKILSPTHGEGFAINTSCSHAQVTLGIYLL